ncbi:MULTISPECIES: hypothetical protein [unclassified Sporosarcina]|uniref:hypothetical protein n=1 Tax=unclassified Sporosarcina TaxID=2647733 RepID=UPI00203E8137|nr:MULTISPECIES: hypothetical protein [unclassified Sporosarcina]GKV65495.1 hypothetical protein NCCP2331_16480 [Sporosarcina sp. NCCP-2331]GLB55620.1 hypothetical protein NCCP2378_14070 [Sporosarcina sp. NCCP-2378]
MYEWLKDYRKLEDEIIYMEFNLDRSQRELKRWVEGDLAGVKLTAESNGARLEEFIEAAEYDLAHKMNDLYEARKLIATFSGLDNQILFGKYVEGKTLLDVAFDLDKSPNYIYNKHAQIMKMIDYAYNLQNK